MRPSEPVVRARIPRIKPKNHIWCSVDQPPPLPPPECLGLGDHTIGGEGGGAGAYRHGDTAPYRPLEPKDCKGSFKGNYRVPLKGFGVI